MLLCPVELAGEVARVVAGGGQVRGGVGDGRAGVGVVVGPDAVGVVFGVEPAAELVEQLREALDEQDDFTDKLVELGRPGEGVGAAGAVVQFTDGAGGGFGEFHCAGPDLRIGHGRSPPDARWSLAGLRRCR